ncbi:MAG: tyrosine-type recombinase/integrase [Planctomycetaceae bacterium]|nr:tyrosine-type recombinase/integrase [Planctomycetaceae bacterium]
MPKLTNRFPTMYRDKNTAVSKHKGQRIYHGVWGSPEADKSYKRFIANLALEENHVLPKRMDKETDVLVSELAAGFLEVYESRMHKSDYRHYKQAVRHLADAYGEFAVNEFSPKKLKTVRARMVKSGLCRDIVNRYTGFIKRIFAWGVEEELVNATVSHALLVVKSLREGEEGAFDYPEREAVSFHVVEKTLPFPLPVYQAFFRILKMTGARPSEICKMRVGDIDKTETDHWTFSPVNHKTARHNKRRVIVFGAQEQAVLLPYLEGKDSDRAVFSPKDAVRERKERDRAARVTPLSPSQIARDKHRQKYPKAENHEHFDTETLGKALKSVIIEANRHLPDEEKIPHWTLYQLRHAAITELVILFGEEKAAMMTGTSVAMVRRIYDHSHRKRMVDL